MAATPCTRSTKFEQLEVWSQRSEVVVDDVDTIEVEFVALHQGDAAVQPSHTLPGRRAGQPGKLAIAPGSLVAVLEEEGDVAEVAENQVISRNEI